MQRSTKLDEQTWTDLWTRRITDFFGAGAKRSKKRSGGAESARVPERAATLAWLRDTSHALSSFGWSFSRFQLDAIGSDSAVGSDSAASSVRASDAPTSDAGEGLKRKRPPVLVVCTDQEPTQLAGMSFLRFSCRLWVEHVSDPGHRSQNDLSLALASCGLLPFATWCVGLYNVKYGPWGKGNFHTKIVEVAQWASKNMSPDDPLVLSFFPDILQDQGRSPDENSREERRAFLTSLAGMHCVKAKGTKAAFSRFNSLSNAHSELDAEWSSFAFVLAVLSIQEGWAKSSADLWSPETGAAQAGPGAVRVTSKSAARSLAKRDVQAERGTSANTLHVMAKFVNNQDSKTMARVIYFVSRPEAVRCSKMLKELRSAASTIEHYASWAHWSWIRTAVEHVRQLTDLQLLAHLGLDLSARVHDKPDAARLAWQDAVAARVLEFTQRLLAFRAGSQLWYTNGFGSCAGLLHGDPDKQVSSLQFLKSVYETGEAVGKHGSLEAKRLLEGHFSTTPFGQWLLRRLASVDFATLPDDVQRTMSDVWGGLLNSKLIEDANKVQREAEQRNGTSKDVGRLEGWHAVTKGGLIKSYEREEVSVGGLCHMPSAFDPAVLFQASKRQRVTNDATSEADKKQKGSASKARTAEEEMLAGVTKPRNWPSHGHSGEQEVLAAFSLLTSLHRGKKSWSLAEDGWHSALMPEGCVVLVGDCEQALYVVRTYSRACLCWPGHVNKDVFRLLLDVTSLYWVHVFDTNVTVLQVQAASPLSHLACGKRTCTTEARFALLSVSRV